MTYSRAALFLASRLQPPTYSSGPRPDGYQFPEVTEEQGRALVKLFRPDPPPRDPDPYGIAAARAWREKAYRGRGQGEGENVEPGANGEAVADGMEVKS